MRLSTRLLLPLLATVVAVMLAYGVWAQRQREETLVAESERETRAYARALALAVERALLHPELGDVQQIIDRVSREPTVYGVLVYDPAGAVVYASEALRTPVAALDVVFEGLLRGEGPLTVRRSLDGEPVLGVLSPLKDRDGRVLGILEVAQPLAFVAAEQSRIRQRFLLNTVTLVAALSVLVAWLVRRYVSTPLEAFAETVRAFGAGEFGRRLPEDRVGSELAQVAAELNRMAERLQGAREDLVREGEERVQLERRLQQSEKMAAVGTLAAGLAHEIGAPLHVIRGRADLVLRRDLEEEVRRRNLRIIVRQIDRITLIVRNLLGYARRREPRRVSTDIADVVGDVAGFLEDDADRMEAEIVLHLPPGGARLEGDPDLLHQVLLNVMLNALHELEGVDGIRRITVRVAKEGSGADARVVVLVEDTGHGMAEAVRERMFEPFFTTKEARDGTGLGLAVARGIVEDHGGRIEGSSRPPEEGGGACIRIELPAAGSGDA